MKKTKLSCLLAMAAITCAPTMKAADVATDSLVQNYMRSSLYTILLNSEKMNAYYEEETKNGENASALISLAKSFKSTKSDDTQGSLFSLPSRVFPDIEIPNQFNDHNLQWRVLNFDSVAGNVSDADLAKFAPAKKKGVGFGKLAKGAVGMNTQGDENNEYFDKYAQAVINQFFEDKNIGAGLIARWYDYSDGAQHWNLNTLMDRGSYNFTADELQKAAEDLNLRAKIDQTAFDMVSNTYVMAVNLRFRSYQAIIAESAGVAKAVGGLLGGSTGSLIAEAATAGASAAAGDGYAVQAVSYLYRLVWNDDINQKFAVDIFAKNASLDDLVASGLCKLEFVGSEKSSAQVRQSILSNQPMTMLVKRATARAIDEAILKLQNKHEEFRTVRPIIGGDGEFVYAAIGTKEGLNEKDEYEILEPQEDKDGKRIYKKVGTVKAVKDGIWDNAYGALEEVAENPNATDAEKEAVNRGYSKFKGKKGDFRGYFIRLKKKK